MSVKPTSHTAMAAILMAEQKANQEQSPAPLSTALWAGIKEGLDFQTIEKALRIAKCKTFLIARNPANHFHEQHIQSRLPDSTENKKYWLYMASGSHVQRELFKESKTYEENLEKLKETGFTVQIIDVPLQEQVKKIDE